MEFGGESMGAVAYGSCLSTYSIKIKINKHAGHRSCLLSFWFINIPHSDFRILLWGPLPIVKLSLLRIKKKSRIRRVCHGIYIYVSTFHPVALVAFIFFASIGKQTAG